ncbi:MAG: biotin--[acetyl-CoA-carboxylase] ligase [Tannerellaceae bacterium]|jgi:BirA family biotin operon repressor/biotin-[acetyl-CoA-carboxylase] ligase|nr:biotin--[acetyl-CoA-carboxylase] ligase [Tannerellaceae bacterium]
MNTYTVIRLKETRSTNLYIIESLREQSLKEGTVVVAQSQTEGKGQRDASWESAPGENLTFSFILRPAGLPASCRTAISQLTALAVKELLEACTDGVTIKWPNDVYWMDKKIAGILIENNISGGILRSSIVGVGINLNQTTFPEHLSEAVSLAQITGDTYDLDEALSRFMRRMFEYYHLLLKGDERTISSAYKASLYRGTEDFHNYRDADGSFEARIYDVGRDGSLILERRDGEKRGYMFKEVSFI